jgi:hypothetical protein
MMLILVRSFVSVPQDVLAASSTVRVVRLDRDYDDLDDLLGVCEIDGVPRIVLSVHKEHDGPWREGEMVVLRLSRVTTADPCPGEDLSVWPISRVFLAPIVAFRDQRQKPLLSSVGCLVSGPTSISGKVSYRTVRLTGELTRPPADIGLGRCPRS